MAKIHPNLALAAQSVLTSVLEDGKRASRTLSKALMAHPKWGARDRKLIYSIVFDVLRWKRYYSFLIHHQDKEADTTTLLACWCQLNNYLAPSLVPTTLEPILDLTTLPLALQTSYPDWLFELGQKELDTIWEKECKALNEQAAVAIRVNRLKSFPKKIQSQLAQQYRITSEWRPEYPDALLLSQGRKWETNPLFRKGFFEIQDVHSQQIAPFTEVQPGDHVIDLCAGAGGKTLHLAALMRNRGQIKAYDTVSFKLKELRKRAKRAGAKIIEVETITPKTDWRSNQVWADVVLIDAPCSGLGTLRRNPEIKWRLTQVKLDALMALQQQLLEQASEWVKPQGVLVYATCSILPSENSKQIDSFLSSHPEFTLESAIHHYAWQSPFDGFFMARLRKTNTL